MQNIIENSYPYELVDDDLNHYKYDFVSFVEQPVPKRVSFRPIFEEYYNLGFGDIRISEDGEEYIDDSTRNINVTDGDKILSTALTCCVDFMIRNPHLKVIFFGNTIAKHRLYRMRLCKKLEAITTYLTVKGALIANFKAGLDDEGFKDLENTPMINPADITYEAFDIKNCNNYDFITFELIK